MCRTASMPQRIISRGEALLSTLLLAVVVTLSGCATSDYWVDRGRDAADIFTATLGVGAGLKARVGPLQLAVFENSDLIGLRAGHAFLDGSGMIDNEELYILPFPLPDIWFGGEAFAPDLFGTVRRRGKDFSAKCPFPGLVIGSKPAFYSQIEAAGGFGITARLGFNAGEFVDFILGWSGADFYHDDIGQNTEPQPNPKLGPGSWTPDVGR